MQKQKPRVKITHWSIHSYESGGEKWDQLVGIAQDHPYLGRGWVRTSKIVKSDVKNRTVETLNSIYELSDPEGRFDDQQQ